MASSRTDAKHVLREIRLLRHLGKHENIVTLEDLIINNTDSNIDKDELYIVLELLDSDLHKVLQSKQQLTEQHYKYFFFQLLNGVKVLLLSLLSLLSSSLLLGTATILTTVSDHAEWHGTHLVTHSKVKNPKRSIKILFALARGIIIITIVIIIIIIIIIKVYL